MPESEKQVKAKARRALRAGKRPTTAAGEFVRQEIHHVREGKHGARSPEQAIAIGLSKARRAGVPLRAPSAAKAKPKARQSAERAYEVGQGRRKPRAPSRRRARAIEDAMKREPHEAASRGALSQHARKAAARRTRAERSAAARKAAATKGPKQRAEATRKAARTRKRQAR
jgi:hypothetical protein